MFTYVDSWKRYKYILTESARGIEFYFEENKTDFRVEIWQNFDESGTGTEVKIYNCGRSRGCFWHEYAHGYSGRGFWAVVKNEISRAGGWDAISYDRIGEVESW